MVTEPADALPANPINPTESAGSAVSALVRAAAGELEPAIPQLAAEVAEFCQSTIPAFRTDDPRVREMLVSSATTNLATALRVHARDIPLEQLAPPSDAVEYSRWLAQRGVAVEALLRAYRFGEKLARARWLDVIERLAPNPTVMMDTVRYITTSAADYIDHLCEHMVAIYQQEHTLWSTRAEAARANRVSTVLADPDLDVDSAERLLGYRMNTTHIGIVAWSSTTHAGDMQGALAPLIVGRTGASPLTALADEHTLWLWASGHDNAIDQAPALTAALHRSGLPARLAVGNPAAGLAGFRRTHEQARHAQRVALLAGADAAAAVTTFAAVESSVFLTHDLPAARRWVRRVLGELAHDSAPATELRHTLTVYLRNGANLAATARALHLHRNTVSYRLRKAEQLTQHPLDPAHPDLHATLNACAHLGAAILTPPPAPRRRENIDHCLPSSGPWDCSGLSSFRCN